MSVLSIDAKLLFDQSSTGNASRADLLRSLQTTGFARLQNHPLSEEYINRAFQWAHDFFALSPEAKTQVLNANGSNPQRGWSRIGSENTARLHRLGFGGSQSQDNTTAEEKIDVREHFDMGCEDDVDFPTQWPPALDGFEAFMSQFYSECSSISDAILGALEASTGLPEGTFAGLSKPNASELRLNCYPAIHASELAQDSHRSRIWPHTDLGVITLLFQSEVGGLEYQDPCDPSAFVPIPPGRPTDIIVNVSETLQRWSNDTLHAGIHRVTRPKEWAGMDRNSIVPERFSIAYFTKAARTANVGSLAHFVKDGVESRYPSITAQKYHRQRLATAY